MEESGCGRELGYGREEGEDIGERVWKRMGMGGNMYRRGESDCEREWVSIEE